MSESLLSDLPRGDPDRRPEDFAPPEAEFAAPADIMQSERLAYSHSKGALFLGILDGKMAGGSNDRHVSGGRPIGLADDRHIVTIAGSRAGKGRASIVPNMLHYPGSVLAMDPKGELATITARQRSKGLGQAVHVLDPFKVTRGYPVEASLLAGFNPLAAMRADSLVEEAALIADALVMVNDTDSHWDESARTFLEGVILHVKTAALYRPPKPPPSLLTVRELIGRGAEHRDGERSMDALRTAMESNPSVGGAVQYAAADFFERPDRERDSVLSTTRRHLKFLGLPGIQEVVKDHSFDLADLKRRPTTLYLCLPARHMGTCSRWLRLFVNLTMQAMEREAGRPAGGHPVLFCLDEFATLGHMSQVEDAAGQIAGFGVKLWPILQDMGQLKALYKDRWETFLGNAGVVQLFGNNDLTTLEWISKRCGRTTIRTRSDSAVSMQMSRQGSTGESWHNETHDLIGSEEASRIFGRDDPLLRQLVIWAGRPPLVLQRAYYDKHALFRDAGGHPLFDV
ncbi:type IV secretory system conjugative DNA transfer family protein [Roseomonas mucosa]